MLRIPGGKDRGQAVCAGAESTVGMVFGLKKK